jgi:hypothetical protein
MFSLLKILFFPKKRQAPVYLKKNITYQSLVTFVTFSRRLVLRDRGTAANSGLFDSQFYFVSYWIMLVKTFIFKSNTSYFYLLTHASLFNFNRNLKRSFKANFWLKNKKFHAACRAFISYVRGLKLQPLYIMHARYSAVLNYFWPVRFISNNIAKHLPLALSKVWCKLFFLRKNKIFYKGRYARNRQTCRVIVYWTLWLNIIFIYGMYFYYYQFVFNFGYVWWGLFLFFASLVGAQTLKYQYYNVLNLYAEARLFCIWLKALVASLIK